MAIAPIDLQTMYSNLNNVAKSSGQEQAAQLAQSVQQVNQVQEHLEASARVQTMNNDKSESDTVNADGKNGENGSFQNNKRKNQGTTYSKNPDDNNKPSQALAQSYVGSIIDITR